MKKNYLFALCAIMALFSACSSDDGVAEEQSGFGVDGTGYISIGLNLPSRSASVSRTGDGGNVFDDGTGDEYKVKDGILILFQKGGSSEDPELDAKVVSAYALTIPPEFTNNSTGNITSFKKETVKVNKPSSGSTIDYAMVILNTHGILKAEGGDLKFGEGAGKVSVQGHTLRYIMSQLVDDINKFTGSDGFFMTNAVLATNPGDNTNHGGSVQLLARVAADAIQPSIAEAEAKPATYINVERGVAKVELTVNAQSSEFNSDGSGTKNLDWKVVGWTLANKEPKSFLVRNWDVASGDHGAFTVTWLGYRTSKPVEQTPGTAMNNNAYRFAGITKIGNENLYRTYWGKDPNYGSDLGLAKYDKVFNAFNADGKNVEYCFENTFDVAHQQVKNTTCVLVQVEFRPKGNTDTTAPDMFTVSQVPGLLTAADMHNAIATKTFNLFGSKFPAAEGKTVTGASVTVKELAFVEEVSGVNVMKTLTLEYDDDQDENTAKKEVSITGTDLETLKSAVTITRYTKGLAYYKVLIKHFGDDLTPWNSSYASGGNSYGADNSAADFLGRYGVLRNNWYQIEVSSVLKLGTATPPEVEGDGSWDDDVENYLSCMINVLSWAKRTQGVDLK